MTNENAAAFPLQPVTDNFGTIKHQGSVGLTAVEHAAIELRVPCCDTPWINKAIIECRRLDYAGQALAGVITDPNCGSKAAVDIAKELADAMTAELTKDR